MITALAGGVGAAKLILGLINILPKDDITVIVNTGDDQLNYYGLYVCPDIDIIMYTIAGIVDEKKGWGIKNDTFNCLEMIDTYGLKTWFNLGDKDLATHIYRTLLHKQGKKLHEITSILSKKLEINVRILPMTNQFVPTFIKTKRGLLHFEEYLIKNRATDKVIDVIYKDIDKAKPAPGVIESIQSSKGIIICPSNPIVSIGPIIRIKDIKDAIRNKKSIAISPIVGDKPIKGPADKLMIGTGYEVSALGVARIYQDFIKNFIIDHQDKKYMKSIQKLGLKVHLFDTIMNNIDKKINLARFTIEKLFSQ
ncbi:MAG: 2-phospho-L-lactate transferase [Candidatus Lokiarchaeota archaeon]|nr:2-phospho-L-lactate transferase [Candidatus Lokiarchaeota archaeon]